ncbi:MAG: MBL fold metallo-hydrolase [Candidatus Caldarchaeum sp.]
MSEVWDINQDVRVIELVGGVNKPVRCFLVKQGDSHVLLDTGYPETAEELLEAIEGYRVSTTLLTHLHLDHSGGASEVKKRKHASVAYHEREYQTLKILLEAQPWLDKTLGPGSHQSFSKFLQYVRSIPEPDVFAYEGMSFGGWRVVHTPGHTAGHVIVVGGRVGITADLILENDTTNVAYIPFENYHPLTEFLKNLTKLTKMNLETIVPSHGPLIRDCRKRAAEIFSHHRQRLAEAAKLLTYRETPALEVARDIRWSKGSFDDLSPVDKWLAYLETLSHLDFLAEAGLAVEVSETVYRLSEGGGWRQVEEQLKRLSENLF